MPTYHAPGVYIEEVASGSQPIQGVPTAVAAFIGLTEKGPSEPTLVTSWANFKNTFGDVVEGAYLPRAVLGFFVNGGGSCYVVKVGDDVAPTATNGAGPAGNGAQPALPAAPEGSLGPFKVLAREAGGEGMNVEVVNPPGEPPAEDDAFQIVVKRGGKVLETLKGLRPDNIVAEVALQSTRVLVEATGEAAARPAAGTAVTLAVPATPPAGTSVVNAPAAGLTAEDYAGDVADRTGLGGLELVPQVTMIAVPDLMSAHEHGAVDEAGVRAVQSALVAHCTLMKDRIAILDPPPQKSVQQMMEWRDALGVDSAFATLYWPWIEVSHPAKKGTALIPPSGHVAGVWARNDQTRGVHKAPANEPLRDVVGLETLITREDQGGLNDAGVNCLRVFPARGIRVWGARTLSATDQTWRYINVRRLFNYIEESILAGTDWVVFEPNDPALWGRIRRTISAFLVNEWRRGALFGLTPEQAFYVRCDETTNPASGIDAGEVVCEIGIAPVKPAEFVIFRLTQFSGGTSAVTE